MTVIKKRSFNELIDNVYQTHCALQENARRVINRNLTIRNWLIGYYIVEYEQNGEDRATYGERLIDEMSKKLRERGLKGFAPTSLRLYRTFYLTYPQIQPTVSVELQGAELEEIKSILPDLSLIQPTTSVEFNQELSIPTELLLSQLTFSHFIELFRESDPLNRLFYEVETIKNNWSVRELKRAMDTSLHVRTGLSKNKQAVIAKIKNLKSENVSDIIRNPYVLEFLGLEEKHEYSESDLEQSILDHLQTFLMELGTGFCFEARQKRITFNNKHYRIDLVFYHRILKCHVLIDLKIGSFDHADAGQMTVYLNYYKKNEMAENDNPPIGIILCADKDDTLVEYATDGVDKKLFVSKYLLKLPDKAILEEFVRKELK